MSTAEAMTTAAAAKKEITFATTFGVYGTFQVIAMHTIDAVRAQFKISNRGAVNAVARMSRGFTCQTVFNRDHVKTEITVFTLSDA